jgi:hypothetical protein
MEFSMPLGFRRANAAVRNAQMNLARERVVLRELERQVVHDLSAATADADRAFVLLETTYNRRQATHEQLHATQAAFDADKVSLDFVLETQRLAADAEVRYHRALVEHAVALKNVRFECGSLLEYDGVSMAEGPWADGAYRSPTRTDGYRLPVGPLNYALSPGRRVAAPPARPPVATPPQLVPLGAATLEPMPNDPVPIVPQQAAPLEAPTQTLLPTSFEALPATAAPYVAPPASPQPLPSVAAASPARPAMPVHPIAPFQQVPANQPVAPSWTTWPFETVDPNTVRADRRLFELPPGSAPFTPPQSLPAP